MKNIILIVVLCLLFGCNNSNKNEIELKKGYAIIEGKIDNFKNDSKVVTFFGNSILGEISQNTIIDSNGNFRAEIELLNPQNIFLSYENGGAHLYIKPNDSLYLEFDINSLRNDKYIISGTDPSTSKYMRDFYTFHGPYTFDHVYGDSVSIEEYVNELKNQMIIEDSILTEFSKQYNPNDEFMHWAKKNLIYGFGDHLMLYYWHFDVNRNQQQPEIYDTKLFPVDDDSAIVTGDYIEHLSTYFDANYYEDTKIKEIYYQNGAVASFRYVLDKIIKNEKPGLSRDIMIYNFLLNTLDEPFDGRDSLWKNYVPNISNKVIINLFSEKKNEAVNEAKINETSLELMSNSKSEIVGNFWKTLATKHKGKIIYVDIWATWCGPCRSEIPYAIDMQSHFEDEQVVFVNLCLASSRTDWEKGLTQNNIEGDNYYFNKDETEILRGELNFRGYPTYMILDKKGNLVDKNAPRPSSGEEIIQYIKRLLDK